MALTLCDIIDGYHDVFASIRDYLDDHTLYLCRSVNSIWRLSIEEIDQPYDMCEWAARNDYPNLFLWAYERGYPLQHEIGSYAVMAFEREHVMRLIDNSFPIGVHTACAAAHQGDVQLLQYLIEKKSCPYTHHVAEAGALMGRIEVLEYMHTKRDAFGKQIDIAAARGNHLTVMQWLHAKDCQFSGGASHAFAIHGNMEALKWMVKNGIFMGWGTAVGAAMGGNLAVLEWVGADQIYEQVVPHVAKGAAISGHLHIIEWLTKHNFPLPMTMMEDAARAGQLHVLEWLWEVAWKDTNENPWGPLVFNAALENGHFVIVKWLLEHGGVLPQDQDTIKAAASSGSLDLLKLVYDTGQYQLDDEVIECAIQSKTLGVLKWVRQQVPFPLTARIFTIAVRTAYWPIVHWLYKIGCPFDEDTCSAATFTDSVPMLRWLRKRGCPWNEELCRWVFRRDSIFIGAYLVTHGCPCGKSADDRAHIKREQLLYLCRLRKPYQPFFSGESALEWNACAASKATRYMLKNV